MSQSNPVGIIPYSSDDDSIILKCSLSSAADVAAPAVGPAGTVTGTTHTFDTTLGFKPAASGNSGIKFAAITGYAALDRAGQISFEIDRSTICAENSSYGSDGYTPGGTEWMLVWDNDTVYGYLRKSSAVNFAYKIHNSDTATGIALIHSQNKSDYVRVTLSWVGSAVDIYVDGYKVTPNTATARVTYASNMFKNISILSYGGATNPARSAYMRNIVVSSKPVNYPVHPDLSTVCVFGHSFANSYSADNNTTSNLDGQMLQLMRKALANNRGTLPGKLYSGGIDGGYVDTALVGDSNLHMSTKVTTALASSPQSVVLLMGTNDVNNASFNAANFDTAYKAIITAFVTGTNGGNIRRIVATTVQSTAGHSTYDTATIQGNIAAANAYIELLPTWFDSTYPTMAGRLVVADTFASWGGISPTEDVMIGQLLGSLTNLHPSPLGGELMMENVAENLI